MDEAGVAIGAQQDLLLKNGYYYLSVARKDT